MDLKVFFNFFFEYLETLDFKELKDSILSNEALQQSKLSFKVEPNFLSIFRIFSLLDGTCALLNPNFSYIETLAPYAQNVFFDTVLSGSHPNKAFSNFPIPGNFLETEQGNRFVRAVNSKIYSVDKGSIFTTGELGEVISIS